MLATMSHLHKNFLLMTAVWIIVSLSHRNVLSRDCEVEVVLPWKRYIYSQPGSSVFVDCTAEGNDNPAWSIRLPGRENFNLFAFEASIRTLNDQGFYELPEEDIGTETAIQLLINNTLGKNGTVIRCIDAGLSNTIAETILIVNQLDPVELYVMDVDLQTVEISWSPLRLPLPLMIQHPNETYNLSVISSNSQPHTIQIHERSYLFTAPEGAPPCDVYNISVLAIYHDIAGTTYTGDGCSVPTPVIQRMLPSLPNISNLESHLSVVLKKNDTGKVSLKVSFPIPQYCPSYFITAKRLDIIEGPVPDSLMIISERNSITVHNLFNDEIYKFKIVVFNKVASASTKVRKIYTSDVQEVQAKQIDTVIQVQCNFISRSDAQGCMVVLVGDTVNTTANVTRCGTCSLSAVWNLNSHSLSCYHEVFAFDIESDGSLGDLAIAGELINIPTPNEAITSCAQSFPSSAYSVLSDIHGNHTKSTVGFSLIIAILLLL